MKEKWTEKSLYKKLQPWDVALSIKLPLNKVCEAQVQCSLNSAIIKVKHLYCHDIML